MHPRTAIINTVVAALLNNTSAAARVFPTRKTDYLSGELPAISVYIPSEDSDYTNAPRELERSAVLLLECIVTSPDDVDLAMNDLAQEIEDVMNIDDTFGRICYESELKSTDLTSQDEGGTGVGVLEMVYTVRYRTEAFIEPTGDDLTTDYDTTTVVTNLEGAQADEDTTDDNFVMEE